MKQPPRPVAAQSARGTHGGSPLEHALNAERALTLGRLGRNVERTLAAWHALPEGTAPASRARVLQACADAVWHYFIQREAHGLVSHQPVIEHYGIPAAVLIKVGVMPGAPGSPSE